jgi:hypothetical protein
MDDYIGKPVRPEELREALVRWLAPELAAALPPEPPPALPRAQSPEGPIERFLARAPELLAAVADAAEAGRRHALEEACRSLERLGHALGSRELVSACQELLGGAATPLDGAALAPRVEALRLACERSVRELRQLGA